jgi:hypothetical protein
VTTVHLTTPDIPVIQAGQAITDLLIPAGPAITDLMDLLILTHATITTVIRIVPITIPATVPTTITITNLIRLIRVTQPVAERTTTATRTRIITGIITDAITTDPTTIINHTLRVIPAVTAGIGERCPMIKCV